MYFKKETFLILGLMKSGISCGTLLLKRGAKCYFYENNPFVKQKCSEQITSLGGIIIDDDRIDDVLNEITVLLLSPGFPIDNAISKKARDRGVRITGELELGCEYLNSTIIAITGTNGKTTTTYLIDDMLKKFGIKSEAVGNVGTPVTSLVGKDSFEDVAVTEVSSFQLETCNRIIPHIAVILNITPDHLERHYTFENYVYMKSKLIQNMRESEFAVLNYDDLNVREMKNKTRAKVVYFSLLQETNGAYLRDDKIFYKGEYILDKNEILLKGEHNVSNVLACLTVAKLMGVDTEIIKNSLKTFKGAKHRIEYVTNVNGIDFYNDSKSTNPDSTIKAVETMEKQTLLLLGGKDKNLDFKPMMEKLGDKVKGIYLYGEARYKLYEDARSCNILNISLTNNMESAVKLAFSDAKSGQTVLLSPACSSFDEFNGYEERGERFIGIVKCLH